MFVCDAFDAMTSQRSYGQAKPHEEALAELRDGAGTQFDPAVVEAFELAWRKAGDGSRPGAAATLSVA